MAIGEGGGLHESTLRFWLGVSAYGEVEGDIFASAFALMYPGVTLCALVPRDIQ